MNDVPQGEPGQESGADASPRTPPAPERPAEVAGGSTPAAVPPTPPTPPTPPAPPVPPAPPALGEPPSGGPPPGDVPAGIPWEQMRTLGVWPALWQTIHQTLLKPAAFYRRMPPEDPQPDPPGGPIFSPFLFALAVGIPSLIAGFVWSAFWDSLGTFRYEGHPEHLMLGIGSSMVFIAVSPLLVALSTAVMTTLAHIILLILKGAGAGVLATWRTVCYSTSAYLICLLPCCGSVVGAIWQLVILIIGLAEVHRTTRLNAALAVLLPAVLCCGFFFTTVLLVALIGS